MEEQARWRTPSSVGVAHARVQACMHCMLARSSVKTASNKHAETASVGLLREHEERRKAGIQGGALPRGFRRGVRLRSRHDGSARGGSFAENVHAHTASTNHAALGPAAASAAAPIMPSEFAIRRQTGPFAPPPDLLWPLEAAPLWWDIPEDWAKGCTAFDHRHRQLYSQTDEVLQGLSTDPLSRPKQEVCAGDCCKVVIRAVQAGDTVSEPLAYTFTARTCTCTCTLGVQRPLP